MLGVDWSDVTASCSRLSANRSWSSVLISVLPFCPSESCKRCHYDFSFFSFYCAKLRHKAHLSRSSFGSSAAAKMESRRSAISVSFTLTPGHNRSDAVSDIPARCNHSPSVEGLRVVFICRKIITAATHRSRFATIQDAA